MEISAGYFMLFKFVLFAILVVGLTLIAKNISPRLSGILAAFPTTQAFALFFFAYEVSPEFAAQSSLYNLMGILAASCLVVVYFLLAQRRLSPLVCGLVSALAFASLTVLLPLLENSILNSIATPLMGIILIILVLNIDRKPPAEKILSKPKNHLLIIKAIISSIFVLGIIEIGKSFSPETAGVISAFPATLFPTLFIVHKELGTKVLRDFIIGIPLGQLAMIAYGFTNYSYVVVYGISYSTLLAYLAAILAIILLKKPLDSFLNGSMFK